MVVIRALEVLKFLGKELFWEDYNAAEGIIYVFLFEEYLGYRVVDPEI